jgi:hypothetical protein
VIARLIGITVNTIQPGAMDTIGQRRAGLIADDVKRGEPRVQSRIVAYTQ